jgi:N-methylhydantoinase B/oxoprolinase/acetone carboxylase alpha subunit
MGITLQQAAFSANIKERRDFPAIFDPTGRKLSRGRMCRCTWGRWRIPCAVLDRLGRMEG